jgi:hypothetical protein
VRALFWFLLLAGAAVAVALAARLTSVRTAARVCGAVVSAGPAYSFTAMKSSGTPTAARSSDESC